MTLYPAEGYGESWHTRFEVAGVPVFYLPYFYFPLDDTRRSGLLYPTLSSSETDGYDLAIPYYFNIAPNVDDTLTARLIEHRGLLLENEARYLNRYSMNTLNTGWISDDDIYGDERWLLNFNHSGNPAPGFSSAIEYSRVSDNDYFDDLMPVEIRVPTSDNLNQRASLSYSAATWNASVLVNDYQTIDGGAEPYARMPQLTLSGAESYSDLRLGYLGQFTEFKHDTLTDDGQRVHLRPVINYDLSRTWGYLRPELGLWHSSYDLSDGNSYSATANFASLDSGLIFERQGELATHTLEPRMKLISVAGDDTATLKNFDSSRLGFSAGNLFNTLGYSGNDRVAQTDQATLGLTSRVYSLSGREMVTASIAQAHYFNDHDARPGDARGTEDSSDYAVSASWKPSDVLKLSHDSRIDKDDGTLLSQNYGLMYNPDDAKLVYASFRQAKSNADTVTKEQIDLAAKWPLNPAWSVVGRYTEDLKESENLETLLGLEYGSCCWKIRFTGQRAVKDGSSDYERENALYLQFVLKGLGTLGGAEGREFLKDLTGFDEDKNENF
jgi:LPS-assembly protein